MSLKAKLVSTIISFCLVFALISVGVWAASTASVTMGGTVTFQATNVYCDVSGTIANMDGTAPSLDTLKYDSNSVDGPTSGDVSTWAGNPLSFDSEGTAVTYTITIKNNSTERYIKVKLTDTAAATAGLGKAITFNGSSYTSGTEVQVPANTTRSFVITFSLSSLDASITNAPYAYTMSLTDQNA